MFIQITIIKIDMISIKHRWASVSAPEVVNARTSYLSIKHLDIN